MGDFLSEWFYVFTAFLVLVISIIFYIYTRSRDGSKCNNKDMQKETEEPVASKVVLRDNKILGSGAIVGAGCVYINQFCGSTKHGSASCESFSNEQLEAAIQKVQQAQSKSCQRDLHFPTILNVNIEDIPVVHPAMCEEDFYDGFNLQSPSSYEPKHESVEEALVDDTIDFAELTDLLKKHRFIALVGPPGSGKTTCSKRLAKVKKLLCFRIQLATVGERELTLRQLLLDNQYDGIKHVCEPAFEWIKNNQEKCCIIMDGFDQLSWTLEGVSVVNSTYDLAMTPQQLIANLCGKMFLPDINLVLTSRPHAMMKIAPGLRPRTTVLLQDLSAEDMHKLLFALARDKAEALWENLNTRAPLLLELCRNPLMLVFTVWAAMESHRGNVSHAQTVTGTFSALLQLLRRSMHAHTADITELFEPLSRLAWKATERSTIVLTEQNLRDENLKPAQVQDLIFTTVGTASCSQRLFEGDAKLYFIHQTWQEYFSAYYISHYMDLATFKQTVPRIVTDSKWVMVRRFLCGHLLGGKNDQQNFTEKSRLLFEEIKEHIGEMETYVNRVAFVDIMLDLLECTEDYAESFAELFPEEAIFRYIPFRSSSAHALGRMLKFVKKPLKILNLNSCKLSLKALQEIRDGVVAMEQKIGIIKLSYNGLNSEAVDVICDMLPKVSDELWLLGTFRDASGQARNPTRKELKKLCTARMECGNLNLKIYNTQMGKHV